MAKRKNPSDWKIDHAKWSFSAEKYDTPVLKLDFTRPPEGDTSEIRGDYLGALRFLENNHFNTNAANGNHFETKPQDEGWEVITLKGVDNIRHLANLLKRRIRLEKEAGITSKPIVAAHLAEIPERLSGTGKNLPNDHFVPRQPQPKEDLFTPASQPVAAAVADAAVKQARGNQTLEDALARARSDEAREKIRESWTRIHHADAPASVKTALSLAAEQAIMGTAKQPAILDDGHIDPNTSHIAKITSARMQASGIKPDAEPRPDLTLTGSDNGEFRARIKRRKPVLYVDPTVTPVQEKLGSDPLWSEKNPAVASYTEQAQKKDKPNER